jgi:hypothetical protein
MSARMERLAIATVSILIAVSAIGGAVGLVGGGLGFPREWLQVIYGLAGALLATLAFAARPRLRRG